MKFPRRHLSYTLQGWIGQGSTETDYRNSVSLLNSILGLGLQGTHVKRVVDDLGDEVSNYYSVRSVLKVEEQAEEGSILGFGHDGKGVPIVKTEREEAKPPHPKGRLMRGQKRGIKKEATVSVDFSFNPRIRDSESVLRGLFKEAPIGSASNKNLTTSDKPMALNVHKRAFLSDQKGAIQYSTKRLVKRMELTKESNKKIIALVDCGTGLEQGILKSIQHQGLTEHLDAIIADIIHVSEYIWKASNVTIGEKSEHRTSWVRARMKDLLEDRMDNVLEELNKAKEQKGLKENQIKTLHTTIRYLTNHRHKMDYKTYLEKGYPISTGLIEGCCGHLVKDRMEDSGMRWTKKGAQNMMDLRAVNKNSDWKEFIDFVQKRKTINKIKIRA